MSTKNQRSLVKERFWRARVEQWRRSGLSVRAFCRERGLLEPNFYAWRRTLAVRDAEAVSFVPVQVVAEQGFAPTVERESTPMAESPSGAVELVIDGRRVLRIRPGFDAATLQRVLPLLEEGRPCR
jgi:transposase